MTTLEYILYDQCNSRKFGPIQPERRALEGELEKIILQIVPLSISEKYLDILLKTEVKKSLASSFETNLHASFLTLDKWKLERKSKGEVKGV